MAQTSTPAQSTGRRAGRSVLVEVLIGLSALAILLQGLWAGIFLEHDGQRDASGWIDVHGHGGEVALGLAALATIAAFVLLRSRRDIWIGGLVLVVLLVVEAYIGGAIHDDGKDTLTIVHVPLAMVIMALAVWLSFRARRGGAVGVS